MRPKLQGGLVPLLLVPVVTALAACAGIADRSASSAVDPQASQSRAGYQAEIRRTAMGVPHIKAGDWGGAGPMYSA